MAQRKTADADRTLDVGDIDGEPFSDIMAALEDLHAGERLRLVNSFEPEPLYDVLDQRGFEYETTRVDADRWEVDISHS